MFGLHLNRGSHASIVTCMHMHTVSGRIQAVSHDSALQPAAAFDFRAGRALHFVTELSHPFQDDQGNIVGLRGAFGECRHFLLNGVVHGRAGSRAVLL